VGLLLCKGGLFSGLGIYVVVNVYLCFVCSIGQLCFGFVSVYRWVV
jgi:hypothetical protein